ncbi:MAG: NAD(P)H-binding protein [Myxococcota bacterium]
MSKPSLLVTGAAGKLGRRTVELLLERGQFNLIATSRTPDSLADLSQRGVDVRRADFDDAAGLKAAFQGAERAVLVSTDAVVEPGRRQRQQRAAVRALEAAGVRHVVYTSLPNASASAVSIAPDHADTEAALEASALGYTILRNNVYAEMLASSLQRALAQGKLFHARGAGRIAYVTRDDCARVAAAAVAETSNDARATFDVSGPEALDANQLAALASSISGRPLVAVALSPAEFRQSLLSHGVPPVFAELAVSFDVAAERGELASVSDSVRRFTGREPESVADFLRGSLPRAAP